MYIQAQILFPFSHFTYMYASIERVQRIHGLVLNEDTFFTLSFVAYMTIDYNSKHHCTTS